jgi:hypothetical protein
MQTSYCANRCTVLPESITTTQINTSHEGTHGGSWELKINTGVSILNINSLPIYTPNVVCKLKCYICTTTDVSKLSNRQAIDNSYVQLQMSLNAADAIKKAIDNNPRR